MNPEELATLMQQGGGEKPPLGNEGGEMPNTETEQEEEREDINQPDKMSAEDQRKLINKAERRYYNASQGMSEHHKMWAMIDMFDRGRQWDSVQLPVWLPKPVTNLIRYVRTTKRANLAQNVPQADFIPMTPIDAPLVRAIQKAYDHVWDEQKVPMMVRRCMDRALLHGTSIAYVYAEENIRGKYFGEKNPNNMMYRYDIKVKRLNNARFYIDPTAYCLNEAKYMTITEPLSFSDVKNNPMFREYAGEKLTKLEWADLQRDSEANGDIFDRPTTKSDMSLQEELGDEMVTVHIHWERYRNKDGAWQVDVSYFMWNTDFLLYRIEDFKPSIYPFAVLYDEEEDLSFWGTSTAMDMLENQKIINKTAQAASIIGTLHQNPQRVVLRESGINAAEMSRTGTLAGKVWTSNVPNAVETLQPPDIPKGLFDIEDRMKLDIKDMAGITESYTGESVGSLTTSTGVDSLIERSTIRDRDKALQIDQFVEDLSNIIVQFILVYWQEERPLMTRAQNGSASFETWKPVNKEAIENLEWRVRSDVYAKAPITAASKSQQADNLMQMQGQFQFDPPCITVEEWIEMKDFPNKEDILARMQQDRANKKQQDAQALQGQVMAIVGQASQLRKQGATEEQVQQQISPMIQQMIQATFTSGQNQGSAGQMLNQGALAPQGTTSPTAMGNMTRG
jgi:hypothetical protein